MSSRCRDGLVLLALAACAAWAQPQLPGTNRSQPLRVCADPDNLPYSRSDGSGFEDRIARLMADELQRPLQTYWLPLRRGFERKTLGAQECDLLIGVPLEDSRVSATRPYYRSSYVLLTRADRADPLRGWDDPRLATQRIGVQLVGDDLAATPAGHALALRGATQRVVGFPVFGDGPAAARIVASLARGELDAALVWGPQAGYFAARSPLPLRLQALEAPRELPLPFEFDIAMGVRRGSGDRALRDALDAAIERRRAEIDAILADFAVPRTDTGASR
jgi:mxaJ protein